MESSDNENSEAHSSKSSSKRTQEEIELDNEHSSKRHKLEGDTSSYEKITDKASQMHKPPDDIDAMKMLTNEQSIMDNMCIDRASNFAEQNNAIDFTSDDVNSDKMTDSFAVLGGYEFNSSNIEEMERLKEFQVLDEVGDEDGGDSENEGSDVLSAESEDVDDEEIERMLEENLPDNFKGPPKEKEKPYTTRHKLLIEEKGTNHFEVLPLDWLVVMHNSGIPVYLHRPSRVCTLAKPYFLGQGSVRKHEIPISAIPCLKYRRSLEEEEKRKEINDSLNLVKENTKLLDVPISQTQNNDNGIHIDNNKSMNENDTSSIGEENNKTVVIKCNSAIDGETIEADKINTKDELLDTQESNVENCVAKNNNAENDIAVRKCPAQTGNPMLTPSSENETCNEEPKASCAPVVLPGGLVLPPARIETVQENWESQHLTHEEVTEYCRRLFKFKNVRFVHFKHWADRRKYTKAKKAMQRPTLPEGTKLISIPAQPADAEPIEGILGRPKRTQREWIMNMNGRSYVSVFHEYVRRALQKQPTYEFRQLENARTPYEATVLMDGMRYGVGRGSSKRQAKSNAARESIIILIPEMREQISKDEQGTKVDSGEPDLAFFDMVGIEDPRIMGFCTTTMEPSPHSILRTCLLRNFGTGDRHIQNEITKLKHEKIEYKMTVGKHTATVVCKNKKIGKQRASQAILQALHPHIKSWGSLLRLYGSRSIKSGRDRKLEEQQITLLQDKATVNQPNYAILDKLKQEMERLNCRDTAVVSIGTLTVGDQLPNLSGSALNHVEM